MFHVIAEEPARVDIHDKLITSLALSDSTAEIFGVYLGVRTCEVFLCFVTIMFVLSIVLISLFSLFYSLVKVTGSYTEDEPIFEKPRSFRKRKFEHARFKKLKPMAAPSTGLITKI